MSNLDSLALDGPITIQVMLGLTLPSISDQELESIENAAPAGSTVRVVKGVRAAVEQAEDVDVILGFIPEPLYNAAPKLRWVHAIASGMDAMLYPAMRDSDVILTGEKGLVGGHLADTGFGLLLALTRQINNYSSGSGIAKTAFWRYEFRKLVWGTISPISFSNAISLIVPKEVP